jgi:hypothetical protein
MACFLFLGAWNLLLERAAAAGYSPGAFLPFSGSGAQPPPSAL